jgi:hypothetical protein
MTINNISNLVGSLLLSELNKTNGELLKAFENLSTGRKINSASDDAAGLAIISRLESQVRGLAQAQENAQLGISKLNVADGYSESISNDLQRIRELVFRLLMARSMIPTGQRYRKKLRSYGKISISRRRQPNSIHRKYFQDRQRHSLSAPMDRVMSQ